MSNEDIVAMRQTSEGTFPTADDIRPKMQKRDIQRLRRLSLAEHVPYDEELEEIVRNQPNHQFLTNPASQNTYLYQVRFVKNLSERYFEKPISELKVLDWGCGKGHVTFLMRKQGARVISCDYWDEKSSDDDSSFGQGTPIIQSTGITVDRLDDAVKLPYPNGSFDVALSFGVLEHVRNDVQSLRELRRVLRTGGMLFCFNLPYFLSWTQRVAHLLGNYYHDRLYTKSGVQHLLKDSGYDLLDIWHRQLLPKNSIKYSFYRELEALDQGLAQFTLLKYFATNIEFVAIAR